MSSSAQRKATFEELYEAIKALPEWITGEILMDGQIETMGRPGRGHRRFHRRVLPVLQGLEDVEERFGWVIEIEPEVRIALDRLVVPDLAGWRVPEDGDVSFLDDNPILRRPDWMCEILSDSTRATDLEVKLPLYIRAGVPHVWIADPDRRRVEVYTGRDGEPVRIALASGDEVVRLPPFDIELPLGTFWLPSGKGA